MDFITRYCYTANETTNCGNYIDHTMNDPTYMIEELKETRQIPTLDINKKNFMEWNSAFKYQIL